MSKIVNAKFLPGDKVRIGDIRGHVSLISVSWPAKCRYEVAYWDSGSKREVWCDEYEVSVDGGAS